MTQNWDVYLEVYKQQFPEDYKKLLDIQQNLTGDALNDHSQRCVLALKVEDDRILEYEVTDVGQTVIDCKYGTELEQEWTPALHTYFIMAKELLEEARDRRLREKELRDSGRMDSFSGSSSSSSLGQDIGKWKGKARAE